MIPGCKVFFQGALWGFTTLLSLASLFRGEWIIAIIFGAACFSSMWFGLDNAFRLMKMEPRS
jgi:hypothetical protein